MNAATRDEYVRIGAVLRAAREKLGYSQIRLGAEIGVSEGTYSRYEAGKQKITIPELRRVIALLGLRIADVVAGDEAAALAHQEEGTRAFVSSVVKETLAQLGQPRPDALPPAGPYLTAAAAIDALDAAFVRLPPAEQEALYGPELRRRLKAARRQVLASEVEAG